MYANPCATIRISDDDMHEYFSEQQLYPNVKTDSFKIAFFYLCLVYHYVSRTQEIL